ncbi:MAG: hypothetical protein RL033_4400 [Pseudomonadota bacterium]|jgi:short subunit dehydrogenase-like uncharacterized protein
MPNPPSFLIYGAYGYTGELIARQAVARGHRPLLAGRNEAKLTALARALDLPFVKVGLEETTALLRAVGSVSAVCHAAGPFIHTSRPLVDACLTTGAHYLDITGELPVFESIFRRHAEAERRKVALIPGVGFDVVPSDCLAGFVALAVPDAHELELALFMRGRPSAGTAKASFEGVLRGNYARRDGELQRIPFGRALREVQFSDTRRVVMPIPWGDLTTAFHTTRIPNITTYLAVSRGLAWGLPLAAPLLPGMLRWLSRPWPRRRMLSLLEAHVGVPDLRQRTEGRGYFWARASNRDGLAQEAWLETADGYAFTAESAVQALEALARSPCVGALTPATAFGTDFVLRLSGSVRYEHLPPVSQRGPSSRASLPS